MEARRNHRRSSVGGRIRPTRRNSKGEFRIKRPLALESVRPSQYDGGLDHHIESEIAQVGGSGERGLRCPLKPRERNCNEELGDCGPSKAFDVGFCGRPED